MARSWQRDESDEDDAAAALRADLGLLRGAHILLAEDNVTNQIVASQMLQALGATVEIASDGAEALEWLPRSRFDLFLLDIEMPRVSGIEVIRAIRAAEPPLSRTPVIAVTAYAMREQREKILAAGADGLIPKPLTGIEQFGVDILAFSRDWLRARRPDSAPRSDSPRAAAAPAVQEPPVRMDVFNGLAAAIGSEAMADLLGKLDTDLARASEELIYAAQAQDRRRIGACAHVLISLCGAIGAEDLKGKAQQLNGLSHGRGEDDLRGLCGDLAEGVGHLRIFLEERPEGRVKP